MEEKILVTRDFVPSIELTAYNPKSGAFDKFSLEENKKAGKWTVLVYYPADFTFVCPTELSELSEKQDEIEALGVLLVSVSTDTEYAHFAWRSSEALLKDVNFLMAADPTGKTAKLFGVYDETSGLALRGTFIINPNGQLVSSEVAYYNVGRSAEELLRKLKACIYVHENPNEVCPAKWVPTEK